GANACPNSRADDPTEGQSRRPGDLRGSEARQADQRDAGVDCVAAGPAGAPNGAQFRARRRHSLFRHRGIRRPYSGPCRTLNLRVAGTDGSESAIASPMRIVETAADLLHLVHELHGAPYIALDTEFMRDQTYWPKLCLMQV